MGATNLLKPVTISGLAVLSSSAIMKGPSTRLCEPVTISGPVRIIGRKTGGRNKYVLEIRSRPANNVNATARLGGEKDGAAIKICTLSIVSGPARVCARAKKASAPKCSRTGQNKRDS